MTSVTSSDLVTADGFLVVRTADSWAVAPSTRREVTALTADQLVALMMAGAARPLDLEPGLAEDLASSGVLVARGSADGADAHRRASAPGPWPEPLDGDTVLEPRAAVVGRITGGALVIEGTDGSPLGLDPLDVHLLDAIDRWITVNEVIDDAQERLGAGSVDRHEWSRRLARIAASGRVRTAHTPDRGPADGRDRPEDAVEVGTEDGPGAPVQPVDAPPPPRSSRLRDLLQPRSRASRRSPEGGAAPPGDPSPSPVADAPGTVDLTPHTPDTPAPVAGALDPTATPGEPALGLTYLADPFPGGPAGPVPVYAVWPTATGPVLALGMLTAAARHHDEGLLNQWYEIRRPEEPTSFFADLGRRTGPAVLLLSNYVWSVDQNLALARRARALCPELLVIHGGPSTPKYEADVEQFFDRHPGLVDVTVRGEGEATLVEILVALGPAFPTTDVGRLCEVAGLSYRDPATRAVVRTADRERIAALDQLPSAYLTGEFDHLPVSAWDVPSGLLGLIFESNRGCPYGCTFCDWGSSTLSRIRKFSLERVEAEMRWAADRGHHAWTITDANFGIIARDVDIADRMAKLKAEYGLPEHFGFNVAKNTTRHLTAILDRLVGAGVIPHFSLALQTRDDATLDAVDRTNISTDHYLALAAAFRRRGLPLDADVMVGLPGQTVDSFVGDLQFLMDHEIPARMWITELLPNAPMNDPAYRERYAIEADENHVVIATSSFTAEDRRTMMRLRHAYTAFERFSILRYVVRYAQWDHGVPAMAVIRRIVELSEQAPDLYPLLNWVMRYFDYFNVAPVGWRSFFIEVGTFLDQEFGIGPSVARDLVLEAQAFLLPDAERRFPASLPLAHDLVGYVRDHTRGLWGDATPSGGGRLVDYGPTVLTVHGDPLGRCERGQAVNRDPRNEVLTEGFWIIGHWELDSPLATNFSEVAGAGSFVGLRDSIPHDLGDDDPLEAAAVRTSPVALSGAGSRSRPAPR